MKRTIPFCAHIFVMVVNDDFWTKRWFRTSFSSCDSGSMVTQQHSIESQIYLSSDFLSPSPHTLSAFICSEQVWYTHIWLWSAIWISSSVFVVTFFCPFFIIFHSSQRQSILLPVKWPCIFFTCISYVYIFFLLLRLRLFLLRFSIHCQLCFARFLSFISSSVRPFMHYLNLKRNADPNLLTLSSAYYSFQSFNYSFRLHDFDHAISYARLIIITCNASGLNTLIVFLQRYFVCVSQWV